jgi:serine/threonine protein kinase
VSSKGTPLYMAPELFGSGSRSSKVDLYSLGVVLSQLACGRFPFSTNFSFFEDPKEFLKQKANFRLKPTGIGLVDRLLPRMLEQDPSLRLSWQ